MDEDESDGLVHVTINGIPYIFDAVAFRQRFSQRSSEQLGHFSDEELRITAESTLQGMDNIIFRAELIEVIGIALNMVQNRQRRNPILATAVCTDPDYECPICMETFNECFAPVCGHQVCVNCINQQDKMMFDEKRNTTCSLCRSVIVTREF